MIRERPQKLITQTNTPNSLNTHNLPVPHQQHLLHSTPQHQATSRQARTKSFYQKIHTPSQPSHTYTCIFHHSIFKYIDTHTPYHTHPHTHHPTPHTHNVQRNLYNIPTTSKLYNILTEN